jgi:hypothetical protein
MTHDEGSGYFSIVRVKVRFQADVEREAIVDLPTDIIMAGEDAKLQAIKDRIVDTLHVVGIRIQVPDPTKYLKIISTQFV